MDFQIRYASTTFTKLPLEIIKYILSFNYDWASKIIQKKARLCFKSKITEIGLLLDFAFFKCNLPATMLNYSIVYKNKILTKDDIFKTYSACKCCERHQVNKPKTMTKWVDTQISHTQFSSCNCYCRHMCRFLCREIS